MRLNWYQLKGILILRAIDSLDHMSALLEVTAVFWIGPPSQEFVDFGVFSIDCLKAKWKQKGAIVIL